MEFYPIPDVNRHYLGLLDCGFTASIGLDMVSFVYVWIKRFNLMLLIFLLHSGWQDQLR